MSFQKELLRRRFNSLILQDEQKLLNKSKIPSTRLDLCAGAPVTDFSCSHRLYGPEISHSFVLGITSKEPNSQRKAPKPPHQPPPKRTDVVRISAPKVLQPHGRGRMNKENVIGSYYELQTTLYLTCRNADVGPFKRHVDQNSQNANQIDPKPLEKKAEPIVEPQAVDDKTVVTKHDPKPRSPPPPNPSVEAVAAVLAKVISENKRFLEDHQPSPLGAQTGQIFEEIDKKRCSTPTFRDLHKFLYNLAYRTRLSHEATIAMLCYVDKVIELTGLVVEKCNYKRVLLTALVCAQKFFDGKLLMLTVDYAYANDDYSKLLPISTPADVCAMEKVFLEVLNFNLSITPSTYDKYRSHLQSLYNTNLDANQGLANSPLASFIDAKTAHGYNEHTKREMEQWCRRAILRPSKLRQSKTAPQK